MVANDPRDGATFDPWGKFGTIIKRATIQCCIQNMNALGLVVSERSVLCFSHYKSMGAICCYGNQSSNPTWPNTERNISLTPLMLQIKFICN